LRIFSFDRSFLGVAQSVRAQDESAKKALIHNYTQIIEVIFDLSKKKTELVTGLRKDLARSYLERILDKFQAVDESCRTNFQKHPTASSEQTAKELAQHLDEILAQLRLASAQLN
jgi:phosphate uptake regulator